MEKEKLPIFDQEKISFSERTLAKDYLKEMFEEIKNELSLPEQRVFELLVLPNQEKAPKMEEFNYPDIEEDRKKIIEIKKEKFRKMDKKEKINYIRAKICESFLPFLIESKWKWKSFSFTETSEFDDWINNVDSVIEFEDKPEKAAVVDFTTSQEITVIGKKIEKILEKIEKGTLSEVKYFKSQKDKKHYHLKMLPSIIIGIDIKTIQDFYFAYLKGKKEKINQHWFKYALFDEIINQCDYFRKEIEKKSELKNAQEMIKKYKELKKIFENLKENPLPELERKRITITQFREKVKNKDKVYKTIINHLSA